MSVPLEVFCCYAREDQEMLKHLKKHLMPLQRSGQITVWSDTNLNAGVEWEKELHQHLESADIILLLISPDFMASDYCYSVEMERAIQRHNEGSTRVIPILLRKNFWDNAPFAKLQMIPINARPIANWSDRDEAFDDITRQINSVISEIQAQRAPIEAHKGPQTEYNQEELTNHESMQHLEPEHRLPLSTQLKPTIRSFHPLPKYDILLTANSAWDHIWAIAWSPDSSLFAFSSGQNTVDLWNPKTCKHVTTLTSPYPYTMDLAWSPDGSILASASHHAPIRLWNLDIYEPRDLSNHGSSLAWSPDGSLLASMVGYKRIDLWNPKMFERVTSLEWNIYPFDSRMLAWSPDGSRLASAHDRGIRFWNPDTYELITTMQLDEGRATHIAWSPDGSLLASGGPNNSDVQLWDTNTYKLITTLIPFKENSVATTNVSSLAWSPDGSTLASTGHGGIIYIWNPSTYTLVVALRGHKQTVNTLSWSPDGSLLASTPTDGRGVICLWHTT